MTDAVLYKPGRASAGLFSMVVQNSRNGWEANADGVRIEVQQHQPVALQPGLVVDRIVAWALS